MVTAAPARASSSAIARPMPREPPVTSAVLPSSEQNVSDRGERLLEPVERRRAVDRHGRDIAVDPLHEPGEDVARADLDERLHALPDEALRRLREPDGRRQ